MNGPEHPRWLSDADYDAAAPGPAAAVRYWIFYMALLGLLALIEACRFVRVLVLDRKLP